MSSWLEDLSPGRLAIRVTSTLDDLIRRTDQLDQRLSALPVSVASDTSRAIKDVASLNDRLSGVRATADKIADLWPHVATLALALPLLIILMQLLTLGLMLRTQRQLACLRSLAQDQEVRLSTTAAASLASQDAWTQIPPLSPSTSAPECEL